MLKKIQVIFMVIIIAIGSVITSNASIINGEESSWLAQELEGNKPFIDATVKAVNKAESQITVEDIAKVKTLNVQGAAEIPKRIDLFSSLDSLYVENGTISSIPEELYSLHNTLTGLGLRNNHLISLPDILFDDVFWNAKSNGLTLLIGDNQITSNVPTGTGVMGMLQFNSGRNMLEHYNYTDYHNNPQSQLQYKGGTPTITVPEGYDFSKATPSKDGLILNVPGKGYVNLFDSHEFVYYDAGDSNNIINNSIATNKGSGSIWVKSSLSTTTNRFAKVKLNVLVVEALGEVTVRYEDTNGLELFPNMKLSGKVGTSYETAPLDIEGYTLVSVQGEEQGVYETTAKEVVYVYQKKNDIGQVVVTYQDIAGIELALSQELVGEVGTSYETAPLDIEGYTLVSVQGEEQGVYEITTKEIVYVYQQKNNIGQVVVKYQDMTGIELAPSQELVGEVGTTYEIAPLDLEGYTLASVQGEEQGVYETIAKEVVYVYQKKNNTGQVVVTYQDIAGIKLAPSQELVGEVGTTYETAPLKLEGYTLVGVEGEQQGRYGLVGKEVVYIYEKEEDLVSTGNNESLEDYDGEDIVEVGYIKLPKTGESIILTMIFGNFFIIISSIILIKNKQK